MADLFVAHEPSSYLEANNNEDFDKWQAAMQEEMQAIHEHKMWKLLHPSKVNQKLVDCRCVYKLKPKMKTTP